MRRSRSLRESSTCAGEAGLDVQVLEQSPADLAVHGELGDGVDDAEHGPAALVGAEVPDASLHLEVALVLAVLPPVAVEAVAGADADVDREHRLDLDLEVPEAEGRLLHQAEQPLAASV